MPICSLSKRSLLPSLTVQRLILPAQLWPAKPGLQSQIPVDVSQIPCDGLVQSSGQVRSKNERGPVKVNQK